MRIVAYCRVSTNKDEQLMSLENQEEFFKTFAKKNGHTLINIYSDEGISGKQMRNRTEFLRMLNDAKTGKFDMVVVKDISRFARNTVDFLTAIRELKQLGIEVQFLSTNQTILGNSEFMLTIFSALAQEESANLSSRVRFGKTQNAKKGRVPNFVYGYDKIDTYTLKINEAQARIIQRIFYCYVNKGMGLRAISIMLNDESVPTFKNTGVWYPRTIKRILQNDLYRGVLISKKSETIDFLNNKRAKIEPKEEFIFYRPEFKIVNDEIFDKAQRILKRRQDIYKNKTPQIGEKNKYPFSTLIKCKECNYSFSRKIMSTKNRYIYWICTKYNNNGKHSCCNNTIIKEKELIEVIRNTLLSVIQNKDEFIKRINQKSVKENDEININKLKNEIVTLKSQKKKMIELFTNDIIGLKEVKKANNEIERKLQKIKQIIDTSVNDKPNKAFTYEEFFYNMEKMLSVDFFTNAQLRQIIENIVVDKDRNVEINFKNPLPKVE